MADEPNQDNPKKRAFSLKTLLILAAVLLLEVATAVVAFMLAGGPNEVQADRTGAMAAEQGEKQVEELVIEDRFANSKRGKVYVYDTEIYITIKMKHQEQVQNQLKTMSAQVHADMLTIFRRADPSYMHEDALLTLKRQIKAALDERLGNDAEGKSVVLKVVITRCTPYRADS